MLLDGASRKEDTKPEPVFRPLTPGRWRDLEALFGDRGACGGCWCMYWRLSRSEFQKQKGAGNRLAFARLVESGRPPGVLAYVDREPAGWCAVAPREEYPAFRRSRVLKPVDGRSVWSVTCFFVAKKQRRKGIASGLLEAAVALARKRGARVVEGYPVAKDDAPDVFAWTGLEQSFRKAGFEEAARRSPTRPIMRRYLR